MRLLWALIAAAGCSGEDAGVRSDATSSAFGELHTPEFLMSLCTGGVPGSPTCPYNVVALDDLGPGRGIPGATIVFAVQDVGGGTYLTELKLVAGPMGAHVEHPLFVSLPADQRAPPIADPLDHFRELKLRLTAGMEMQLLSGGTIAFVTFPPGNRLMIYFQVATPL
jgi:hypothetical protein